MQYFQDRRQCYAISSRLNLERILKWDTWIYYHFVFYCLGVESNEIPPHPMYTKWLYIRCIPTIIMSTKARYVIF